MRTFLIALLLAQQPPALLAMTFPSADVGASITQRVEVENPATSPASVTAVASGPFTVQGCAAPVPAGARCALDVTFTPAQPGANTGTLDIRIGTQAYRFALEGQGRPDTAPPTLAVACPAQATAAAVCEVNALADNHRVATLDVSLGGTRQERITIDNLPATGRLWRLNVAALPRGSIIFRAVACDPSGNCAAAQASILLQ